MLITLTVATEGLRVEVTKPEPSGYTEWLVVAGSRRFSGGLMLDEGTTVAAALSHVLSHLTEDCDNDLTRYDYLTDAHMRLGSVNMARALVEQNHGDTPHHLFVAYSRDVVPS
jgi:hypothetical protein